ncbi:hypothetical protein M0R45_027733 [Rubus argutus]|uniref:TFIIB-type domain-containing protein n=1 Tax=Rubus argutus TaxID=59490 RepID=A0AAW1X3Y2_RUBAR
MYCSDCCFQTDVVFDHSTGNAVCSNCGLVLESRSIDETSEWRTLANDDDNHAVRVGGPTNPLLTGGGLSTVIAKPNGEHLRGRNRDPDRGLILAFKTIDTMCDRLGLVATIKDRANEIYKTLEDEKQEDKPRTLKEIWSVANGATKKDIGRAKEYIVKQLGLLEKPLQEAHAGDYIRRFCSALGLNNQAIKAAQEAVHKTLEFDIRRSPISIAAAVIYIITQLLDDDHKNQSLLNDIAHVTGVATATIKSSYKDLHPHLPEIIPNWYYLNLQAFKCCRI